MDQKHGLSFRVRQPLQLQLIAIRGGYIVHLMAHILGLQPIQLRGTDHRKKFIKLYFPKRKIYVIKIKKIQHQKLIYQ